MDKHENNVIIAYRQHMPSTYYIYNKGVYTTSGYYSNGCIYIYTYSIGYIIYH